VCAAWGRFPSALEPGEDRVGEVRSIVSEPACLVGLRGDVGLYGFGGKSRLGVGASSVWCGIVSAGR
jgi:hypothetical protein